MVWLVTGLLNAQSSSADNRNFDLALSSKNVDYCVLIKDKDKKIECFGTIKRNSGYCDMIKDSDLKNKCLSVALSDSTYCNEIKDKKSKEHCLSNK